MFLWNRAASALLAAATLALTAMTAVAAPISSYPAATTPLSGTEELIGTQAGNTVNVSSSQLSTYALSNLNSSQINAAIGYVPAHSGSNSDITSINNLTTPLGVTEGGTGTNTLTGFATSGVNSNITSLTGLSTPLPTSEGGTGAANLNALAKSGVNSDITSLTGLSTPLPASEGGTGVNSLAGEQARLGLGTAAYDAIGTSGATLCLLNTACSWANPQTYGAATSSNPSIILTPGTAPSSSPNGGLWITNAGVYAEVNGNVVLLGGSSTVTSVNGRTGAVTISSSDVTGGLGYTPLDAAGTVSSTGKQTFAQSTTSHASINLPQGTAPSSPGNGDCWTTSVGFFCYINGSTQQLASTSGSVASFNGRTGVVTLSAADVNTVLSGDMLTGKLTLANSATGGSGFNIGSGVAPTSPTAGDFWGGTGGVFYYQGGVSNQLAYTSSNITGSAAKLTTARTIGLSGDGSWTSAAFDGSGNVTGTFTLSTVNANTGNYGASWSIPTYTVNGKGLITASGAVTPVIPNATVANNQLANMGANSIKCNPNGSSSAPQDCSAATIQGLVGVTPTRAVQYQYSTTSGSSSGETLSNGGWTQRTLNANPFNNLSGTGLSGNQVTLPAGTYQVTALATAHDTTSGCTIGNKVRVRDVSDGWTVAVGPFAQTTAQSTFYQNVLATAQGTFTIGGSKVFEVDTFNTSTSCAIDGGSPSNSGESEVYVDVMFEKIG